MMRDTPSVSPGAVRRRVRSPPAPPIARSVKLATPLAVVVAVSVPPNVPPPVAIAAVTTTPAWLTALPDPSRNCTAGCWVKVTPFWAVADGWVVTVTCVAAPAVIVMGVDVAPVGPVGEEVGERVDPGGGRASQEKIATPLAVVGAGQVPPHRCGLSSGWGPPPAPPRR